MSVQRGFPNTTAFTTTYCGLYKRRKINIRVRRFWHLLSARVQEGAAEGMFKGAFAGGGLFGVM